MKLKLFVKNNCPQCRMTEQLLKQLKIDYVVENITENDGLRAKLRSEGYLQTPVVITSETSWTGFRPDRIKELVQ
ncbi:glutaredoxin family protein (plasmid) [Limosilactobacillus reuteri]|uniref:Glutaredoxin family protein n=1 Tax=Limosilactobacillus reuteri TaxID=1598 RepID=A0A517D8I6_LIMRT|nr:glutaredoxin family protein [Limosilactobacillus reuteri]QDR73659.1 glutaredoxin family protein [Limosilactobacillus reuteri]